MSQDYPPKGEYPPQGGPPPPGGYPQQGGYPPAGGYGPQAGYTPQQGGTATVVIQTAPHFGREPVQMQCPHCNARIVSRVDYIVGGFTWLIVCLLFWFVCVIFSPIPCCVDTCKDARHTCPDCNRVLGHYRKLEDC